MRKFEFRAWNEETKSYSYFDLYNSNHLLTIEPGGHELRTCFNFMTDDMEVEQLEFCDIQQCIGFKGKDDEDIYEGDIVKHKMPDTPYNQGSVLIGVIEYEEETASYRTCGNFGAEPIHLDVILEVIGNKNENPELLNLKTSG